MKYTSDTVIAFKRWEKTHRELLAAEEAFVVASLSFEKRTSPPIDPYFAQVQALRIKANEEFASAVGILKSEHHTRAFGQVERYRRLK